MITINGTYNDVLVYTDQLDNSTTGQLKSLSELASLKDSQIRIMPDVHSGTGCVIGTTLTLGESVIPSLVGVDIGCGVFVVKLEKKGLKKNFDKLERLIRNRIPSGKVSHQQAVAEFDYGDLKSPVNYKQARRNLGTLGGGNHFIEVAEGVDGVYLVIHSGSRSLGQEVANYYQEMAYATCLQERREMKELVKKDKQSGKISENEPLKGAYEELTLPREHAYLTGQGMTDYLADLAIAQAYAAKNRQVMAETILKGMKWDKKVLDSFDCPHNYIDLERKILRKGATAAELGQPVIIPLNMRDGSILAVGKGNPSWNQSAPHGAGRLLSRSAARKQLSLEKYEGTMKGIWTQSVSKQTLDEAPGAYKKKKQILGYIEETVDVKEIIKPLYNFKGK
ncbi:RtcB family protein [uncultured Vagococcus sp.]|uniref:RtcB family protein n=1 Tax=uncultured Vagococcus sp. TaxID=189676 RepID=UPI0028D2AB8E|nr:RtcB family protein [uncultured Vagococcus sp.]